MKDSTIKFLACTALLALGIGMITAGYVSVVNHQTDVEINKQTEVEKSQIVEAEKTKRAQEHVKWFPWN